MCYNIAYLEKRAERLEARYGASFKPQQKQLLFYHVSGFVHPQVYVITQEEPQFIQQYQWGLIPAWCKDEKQASEMSNHTLNAMCETVFEKPSFRSSILKRRCLVLVSGFYEWHTLGKKKFPFYVHHQNQNIMSLGGIYEHWVNKATGEMLRTFSIITTPANGLLSKIHNAKKRMPLILDEKDELMWISPHLNKEEIISLMKPLPDNALEAYPVSGRITDRKQNSNVPEVMTPFSYSELKNFYL